MPNTKADYFYAAHYSGSERYLVHLLDKLADSGVVDAEGNWCEGPRSYTFDDSSKIVFSDDGCAVECN